MSGQSVIRLLDLLVQESGFHWNIALHMKDGIYNAGNQAHNDQTATADAIKSKAWVCLFRY